MGSHYSMLVICASVGCVALQDAICPNGDLAVHVCGVLNWNMSHRAHFLYLTV